MLYQIQTFYDYNFVGDTLEIRGALMGSDLDTVIEDTIMKFGGEQSFSEWGMTCRDIGFEMPGPLTRGEYENIRKALKEQSPHIRVFYEEWAEGAEEPQVEYNDEDMVNQH